MRELRNIRTIADLFFDFAGLHPNGPYLSFGLNEAETMLTADQFIWQTVALANYWLDSGFEPGDRVALISGNRPEWHVVDFAASLARLILVPLYPSLSPNQKLNLLAHSGSTILVISSRRQYDELKEGLESLPSLRQILVIDDNGDSESFGFVRRAQSNPQALERLRVYSKDSQSGDIFTVVYTSGTTGNPKGVQLTHANVLFDLDACLTRLTEVRVESVLSVLPLSHILERLLCYAYFARRARITYGEPNDLRLLMQRYRPDTMGCVPRILEKMHETIRERGRSLPVWKQRLSARVFQAAYVSMEQEQPSWKERALKRLGDRLVFSKIRSQISVRQFVCGGAWLDPAIEKFFRAAGFVVLQGYGLTETSPVIALNPRGRERLGSVGLPLDGVEVRLAEDNEILVRGPITTPGYYRDAEATEQAFAGGWFHTGDIGSIDADGYLTVTGRKKELLILSTGKNVSCGLVERAILQSHLVAAAIVLGHHRKFTCAFLSPNEAELRRRARDIGIREAEEKLSQLLLAPAVLELYRNELLHCQKELADFERVKRFSFLEEAAWTEMELLTPTQKLRRTLIETKLAAWIDRMYEADEPVLVPREIGGASATLSSPGSVR